MRDLTELSTVDLQAVTGGGAALDRFVRNQRAHARTELKNATCDAKAIDLGSRMARGLYGKPSDHQSIDAIGSVSEFCRQQSAAPLGTPRLPR